MKKDRRPKLEDGWRYLEPHEIPMPFDEIREKGSRRWERNYIKHINHPAGHVLWRGARWKREINPQHTFVALKDLPKHLKESDQMQVPRTNVMNSSCAIISIRSSSSTF